MKLTDTRPPFVDVDRPGRESRSKTLLPTSRRLLFDEQSSWHSIDEALRLPDLNLLRQEKTNTSNFFVRASTTTTNGDFVFHRFQQATDEISRHEITYFNKRQGRLATEITTVFPASRSLPLILTTVPQPVRARDGRKESIIGSTKRND